jgi:two-component system, response regulator PdtaR
MRPIQKAVLVVEDDFFIREDAVDMATQAGFVVFEAANADEAIAVLEVHPEIGLIFTDIEMPGTMDGLKLAEYVRHRWPPIKLIVTSGKVSLNKAALPEGGLFFSKPYDRSKVSAAMHRMLAG